MSPPSAVLIRTVRVVPRSVAAKRKGTWRTRQVNKLSHVRKLVILEKLAGFRTAKAYKAGKKFIERSLNLRKPSEAAAQRRYHNRLSKELKRPTPMMGQSWDTLPKNLRDVWSRHFEQIDAGRVV